jgi:hypothetical protein
MNRAQSTTEPPGGRPRRWTRRRASEVMGAGLRAFYAADPRRGGSPELDYGLRWRSAQGTTYRAAWIADTEELYSVRHSGDAEKAEVTVLARVRAEVLDRVLTGWRKICDSDEPGSYEWLVERAASARLEGSPAF